MITQRVRDVFYFNNHTNTLIEHINTLIEHTNTLIEHTNITHDFNLVTLMGFM